MTFDLVLKNCRIIIPRLGLIEGDIGIKDGKISSLSRNIKSAANKVVDVSNKVVFPGIVDAHFHVGMYRPLDQDAVSESRAAVTGGVTTILSYFRIGSHYLNARGPYREVFKKVLELSKPSFVTDYGFHLAPVTAEHLSEITELVENVGVSTFKYFMFFKGLDITGGYYKREAVEEQFSFAKEIYDLGFLLEVMRKIASVNEALKHVRLSMHCEDPELIRVTLNKAKEDLKEGRISPLEAYNQARPPLAESFAIAQAIVLADSTGCPINILHISSILGVRTAQKLLRTYPNADVTLETCIQYLTLTTDIKAGVLAKVNPPLRCRDDNIEALWAAVGEGSLDVVASDHVAIPAGLKERDSDVWSALPGFGGCTLLLPMMISEGYHKRGLPLVRIAELTSFNPSRIHGLYPKKGTVMIGSDADLVIVDIDRTQKVTAGILNSTQEFTPFEGMEVKGWPAMTILRGEIVFEDGTVIGQPGYGKYVMRPVSFHNPYTWRTPK